MLVAVSLLGLAGWQAVRISGEERALQALVNRPPPARTRSTGRVAPSREIATADPISRYLAAGKRGMTNREIHSVADDFRRMGLDQPPTLFTRESLLAYREKQHAWYALAVAEALGLSKEQKAEMRNHLAGLLEAESVGMDDTIAQLTLLSEHSLPRLSAEDLARSHFSASAWLTKDGYAPWDLCDLMEDQVALTTKRLGSQVVPVFGESSGDPPVYSWLHVDPLPIIQDPVTGKEVEFMALHTHSQSEPAPPPDSIEALVSFRSRSARVSPYFDIPGTGVFPLTPEQAPPGNPNGPDLGESWPLGDVVRQCRFLQPAQLRMALLFKAELATTLVQRIDHPPSVLPNW